MIYNLVFENEFCKFYENEVTKSIDEYLIKKTINDVPPLENCCVLLAEQKSTGMVSFVLFQDGLPIYQHTQLEAIGSHIDMLRLKLKFEEEDND